MARLSPEQIQEIERHLEEDRPEDALNALAFVAQREKDVELRKFVVLKRAYLKDVENRRTLGTIEREQYRVLRQQLIQDIFSSQLSKALFDDALTAEEKGAPPPPSSRGPTDAAQAMQGPASAGVRGGGTSAAPAARRQCLRCEGLSKHFAKGFTLPPVSFSSAFGEIVGVVGFNGSGKSTLLRMIVGDLTPSAGSYEVSGLDEQERPIHNPIAYVEQRPAPWGGALAAYLEKQAAFYGYNDVKTNDRVVGNVMALLDLDGYAGRTWGELSGGYRMRAAIAAALVANPGLLVLDEPLAPIDPRGQQRLLMQLRSYARVNRTAVLLSSLHIPEIESLADAVILIGAQASFVPLGRIHENGNLFEVTLPPAASKLNERLEGLRKDGAIGWYVVQATNVVVRTENPMSIEQAAALLTCLCPVALRDITHSALAHIYGSNRQAADA